MNGETSFIEDSTLTELLGSVTRVGYGFVLARPDRRIIYANDAAKAVMCASRSLCCSNDCIGATNVNASQQLQSLVSAATRQKGEPAQGGSMILRENDGVATQVVHVVPLSRLSAECSPYEPTRVAGLVIFDCQRWNRDRVKVFSKLFALTPAESRVLSQLLSGGGVAQAATQLNIAQATVETHLKRICKKAGTRQLAELVNLLYEVTLEWCAL
jgi:DNA-binding CsgD family transcriptional regulator